MKVSVSLLEYIRGFSRNQARGFLDQRQAEAKLLSGTAVVNAKSSKPRLEVHQTADSKPTPPVASPQVQKRPATWASRLLEGAGVAT